MNKKILMILQIGFTSNKKINSDGEKIQSIVNMKDETHEEDSTNYFDYEENLPKAPLPSDESDESFYITYILEFIEDKTVNLDKVMSLFEDMKNINVFFLMVHDLIQNEIVINSSEKIIINNGKYIIFDNEILYEDGNKKFSFLFTELQYKGLIKILHFFKNKNINSRKYENLINFFENINKEKYVTQDNNLSNLKNTNQNNTIVNSPIVISKTSPNLKVNYYPKSKKKNNKKKPLSLKKSLSLNNKKNPSPSINVVTKKKQTNKKKTNKK
jgi:hypothetical protein